MKNWVSNQTIGLSSSLFDFLWYFLQAEDELVSAQGKNQLTKVQNIAAIPLRSLHPWLSVGLSGTFSSHLQYLHAVLINFLPLGAIIQGNSHLIGNSKLIDLEAAEWQEDQNVQ